MEMTIPSLLKELKTEDYMSPEEYSYWKARENRTFFIDYEIDDTYMLM